MDSNQGGLVMMRILSDNGKQGLGRGACLKVGLATTFLIQKASPADATVTGLRKY
ncbi:hypothetical protein SAY87_028647 [Trapa incisa]|nr:hypothetical protein SAY87_028647 [Trapa incisa]